MSKWMLICFSIGTANLLIVRLLTHVVTIVNYWMLQRYLLNYHFLKILKVCLILGRYSVVIILHIWESFLRCQTKEKTWHLLCCQKFLACEHAITLIISCCHHSLRYISWVSFKDCGFPKDEFCRHVVFLFIVKMCSFYLCTFEGPAHGKDVLPWWFCTLECL